MRQHSCGSFLCQRFIYFRHRTADQLIFMIFFKCINYCRSKWTPILCLEDWLNSFQNAIHTFIFWVFCRRNMRNYQIIWNFLFTISSKQVINVNMRIFCTAQAILVLVTLLLFNRETEPWCNTEVLQKSFFRGYPSNIIRAVTVSL